MPTRLISGVLAAALLLSVLLLPEVPVSRLAALRCHELLAEPVGPDGDGEPLWRAVLEGPDATREGGGLQLVLGGVRVEGEDAELETNLLLRRNLVRGLRQSAQDGSLGELTIQGENAPRSGGGATFLLRVEPRELTLVHTGPGGAVLHSVSAPWSPPGPSSLLPPLVAVALAILLRRPLVALSAGVLAGAVLARRAGLDAAGPVADFVGGLFDVFRVFLWDELVDSERSYIIGFVAFMLAMVGVMTRAGGIRGMMDAVARLAKDVRHTQVATYLMGLVIFFDDYANTILVGATMRPLTDRLRIAREKLAYIVDSTAAPVAGLSVFSTWIAFEVSTFNAQLPAAGLSVDDGYAVFLQTIPYSFYCIFTLLFVGAVVLTGRDFGPMLAAERRARRDGSVLRPGGTPMVSDEATAMEHAEGVRPAAFRAVLPLATFLLATLLVIAWEGGAFALDAGALLSVEGITQVLYQGSGSWPLFLGSLLALVVAIALGLQAGLGGETVRAALHTLRAMAVAFGILYLAWMIGSACQAVGTAPYLAALIGDAIDARLLPTLLFLLAGAVAFSTGSSWSTMSILLPLTVGLAFQMGEASPELTGHGLMVTSIAAVLSGAIFGDHCSPISDTTVMSSIATASDHIDHVRTQVPYALFTMAVSILVGYLPTTYLDASPFVALGVGIVVIVLVLYGFGRRADEPATPRGS